jgi:hypothetical protein
MVEERIRQAAEQLLGDSSLTGDLDDAEANRLLDWGLDIIRKLCQQTADMDDAQAEAYLAPALKNLRRAIRRINKLVGSSADNTSQEIAEKLGRILESASEVPALIVRSPEDIEDTARSAQSLPTGDALGKILAYLAPKGEIENDQEEKE